MVDGQARSSWPYARSAMAVGGEIRWPYAGTSMAAYVENLMAAVTAGPLGGDTGWFDGCVRLREASRGPARIYGRRSPCLLPCQAGGRSARVRMIQAVHFPRVAGFATRPSVAARCRSSGASLSG